MRKRSLEIKWALIFTAMMLCWMGLEKATGLHDENIAKHALFTNFVAIPAIAIYVFALLEKRRKDFGGNMTYGQGFVSGLFITLFVTILSPLMQWASFNFITPDYFTTATQYAVSSGALSQTEAEAYFNLRNYLIQGTLATPVMGIVTTAIVAIFTRRNKNIMVGEKDRSPAAAMAE
jgi:hypothetical protein